MDHNHPSFHPCAPCGQLLPVFTLSSSIHLPTSDIWLVVIILNLLCGHALDQSWSTHNATFYSIQSIIFPHSIIACDMDPMISLFLMFVFSTLPVYLTISREPCSSETHMTNYIDHIISISPAKLPNE
jgi:hypothetical protein